MNDNLTLAIFATVAALLWIVSIFLTRTTKRLRARSAQLDRELADIMEQTRIAHDMREWQQLERLDLAFRCGYVAARNGWTLENGRRASGISQIVDEGKRRLVRPIKAT